jgi:hypothetical protein
MTCRTWLLENGYPDVAALIDIAMAKIEAKGKKSRRNWWDTLAGGPDGKSSVREGIEFPVLRVAQIRQGKPVTPNAIWRSDREEPPDVIANDRWRRRRLPSKARNTAKKSAQSRRAKAS